MIAPLPIGEFEWVFLFGEPSFFTIENVGTVLKTWKQSDSHGYVFEVDIDIPNELHDKHNELPFLPEAFNKRLTANLHAKSNYKTHIMNLQQAVNHGLIIKHIHRVLRFRQKAWLKGYVEYNTRMRADTTDENMRSFFKLMNNAVYVQKLNNITILYFYNIFEQVWENHGEYIQAKQAYSCVQARNRENKKVHTKLERRKL